ncbi:MAG: hypothetical protein GX620_07070 [Chloroflexi bacterium]|nr:hypothetical protein [Chloroflexota bacterium]
MSHERRLTLWCMIGILLLGAALRFVALEHSPPGLAPDEASNGYDAYSIALTGRDQHGNLLPTVMASLNDYRMPAFIYAATPFVGVLGLSVTSIRMTAAMLGWLGLPLIYWLGAHMVNRRAGLIAALLLALSPWHFPLSRIGLEFSMVSLLVTASVAAVWAWHMGGHQVGWALGAAVLFGLTLYTHSAMKLLAPAMMAGLAVLLWPEVRRHPRQVALLAGICGVMALPILIDTWRIPEMMQARYAQVAVFAPDRPFGDATREALANWAAQISPSFLFLLGDTDALRHPPGMGQLYWIQAPLLALSLVCGVCMRRYRKALGLLILWVALAGVPVALTSLDSQTGHATRSASAIVPWQVLSAAGFAWVWDRWRRWHAVLIVLFLLGLLVQGTPYMTHYFTDYPREVALRFDDGMRQVVETMDAFDDAHDVVVFTEQASWPYLHILFFTQYDPGLLQTDLPVRGSELFAPVTRVGKYVIGDVERMYGELNHGLFVMPEWMLPGVEPLAVTYRSNGTSAYKIVEK